MPWPARKTTSLLFAILLFSGVTIAQTTTYIETSGKGPSLGSIACDAVGISSSFALSSTAGTATTKSFTLTGNGLTAIGFTTGSGVPGLTSWPAGIYSAVTDNTTANANVEVLDVCFYQVSSSGSFLTQLCRAADGNPGFGTPLGTTAVRTFGCSTTSALATSTTDQLLGIIVLENLSSSRQSVTLRFNTSSDTLTFTVVPPPSITSLSTSSGVAGTAVTIAGNHFGTSQGSGTVTFNGTVATISNWSDTSISTSVPALASTGNVVVKAANGEASSGVSFTIPAPIITNIGPDVARVGASVTIAGNNFG